MSKNLKVSLGLAASLGALVLSTAGCSHSNSHADAHAAAAPMESPAYRYALDRAFADLAERRSQERAPASSGPHIDASKLKHFTVFVYPKQRALNDQRSPTERPIHLGPETEYYVTAFATGQCATGAALVPANARQGCLTLEMRPKMHMGEHAPRDIVRVYMDADYHAYGLSYYDTDSTNTPARKQVKLNPQEPLSSELLSSARDNAPIDLPINATNGLKQSQGAIDFTAALGSLVKPAQSHSSFKATRVALDKFSCQGSTTSYKNTYGSPVRTYWCAGDPWPTAVETDHYLALLAP